MINTNVLRKAMREIAANRGNFTLFALLMRADGPGTWDLVVSAPWLESGKLRATSEFVRLLAQSIGEESLQQFSRVLALNSADAPLKFILKNIPVEDGEIRIENTDLLGMQIKEGIILRSMKPKPQRSGLPNTLQPTKRR